MAQKLEKVEGQPNLFLDINSGIFYVRVMIKGRVKWRSTRKTVLKAAISEARRLLGQLEEGREKAKKIPTLTEFWKLYCEAKDEQWSERTKKLEGRIMDTQVLPQLGKLGLDEISQLQVQRLFNWRRKQKTPRGTIIQESSVVREEAVLAAVFNAAVEDEVIERSPMKYWKATLAPTRDRVMSLDEQDKTEIEMSPEMQRWLRFRLATGLRCEEVCGLVPTRDIDWVGKKFQVTGKGYRGKKKTRWVPLIPAHEAELKTLIEQQQQENAKHRDRRSDGPLWPQQPGSLAISLRKSLKRAKVAPGISPHILRHTFATRYLKGGGDIYIVSKILGHASVAVTERVYAHLLTEDLAARSTGIKVW